MKKERFFMKKVLSLILVLVMLCSFAACSTPETNGPSEDPNAAKYAKVSAWVEENRALLVQTFEASFTDSANGLTCSASVTTSMDGFIIDVKINEFDNITDDIKSQLQGVYDALNPTFETLLGEMKKEIAELGFFTINVREVDGDLLAVVNAGK